MDHTDVVRAYYYMDVEHEWARIDGRPEFLLTCCFLDRYIKPGDKVLDIGGGPGRYALRFAAMGCDMTLLDLSPENVRFAKAKAEEQDLKLRAVEGDARTADDTVGGPFDHVLLMGPLYHLQNEHDRAKAVAAGLRLLKPGGVLYASFINLFAGMVYAMKHEPECVIDPAESSRAYMQAVLNEHSFGGALFTQAFFIKPSDILPFMAQFPITKLHLIGQESVLSPCESNIMSKPKALVDAWLDLAEKLAEREDLFSWSEHLMYIGRKR